MAFLNSIETVQTPVTALGNSLVNRHCEVIATCDNGFMASALADMVNKGIQAAEAEYLARMERAERIVKISAAGMRP